ncbi:MAG: SDR family NAD(P)-dependent oxidoreductase [Candidatus Schekmanbacteria bacterium]|nr:SDR family NAD(P)-dependent oxidoreductase [Candidatus Schekmanbacteria bacterium]
MGLFDGKVVIVTGAGGGLGRAYALAFAREGAKVVVNDLGGTREGGGSGMAMADRVVAEIAELGGAAVASYDSVATRDGALGIIKTAVDAFGRVDVLVNNAGILRDKSLRNLSDELWDTVVNVHLKGTFLCSQLAADQMTLQGSGGRIINTSSYAGLKGNFGQANYGSAKAGIAGFTRVIALELQKKGITVNAIAPMAKTRMTDDIDMVPEDASPDLVAPMVLYLASDLARDITGRIFGVHGNHLFEYRMEMTKGVDKGKERWSPREIHERLEEIAKSDADRAREDMRKAAPGGAGAARVDPAEKCRRVLGAIASALNPEKAGDWRAILHFAVKGCGDFSMTVSEGRAAVADGASPNATCVIRMDDETFFGMAEGKIDGTQAFIQGRVTTTNMADMMRYGTSFDQRKAQAAVRTALAEIAGPGPQSVVEDPRRKAVAVLEAISSTLLPERAGDWKAHLHFCLAGCGDFGMLVDGGAARVVAAAPENPTCVLKMDADTFFGMAQGKIDGTQAFMQGKITATNMGDMMKYGTCFDQKAAAKAVRAALEGLAGTGAAAAVPPATPAAAVAGSTAIAAEPAPRKGLNRAFLGKVYTTAPYFVRESETIPYALATNDPNPFYIAPDPPARAMAPVLFPVRILRDVCGRAALDPELNVDFMMLLHGEQDMRFHQPIYASDLIEVKAAITAIEEKSSGEILDLTGSCLRNGSSACDATFRFFIRSRDKSKKKDAGAGAGSASPAELPELAFSEAMVIRPDQTLAYAAASGDDNPIHVDDSAAKAAGLGGIIVHGLCTMAFASQAFVKNAAGGDPRRLKRLKVRFSRPVRPGDTVTTQAWKTGGEPGLTIYGFNVINSAGETVVTDGIAEVSQS